MWQRIYFPTRRQLDEAAAIRAQLEEGAVEAVPATK
jgi:hypothetical protein